MKKDFQKPEDSGMGSVVYIYTFVKITYIVHFKSVHFTVCELYLNIKRSKCEILDFNTFQ